MVYNTTCSGFCSHQLPGCCFTVLQSSLYLIHDLAKHAQGQKDDTAQVPGILV